MSITLSRTLRVLLVVVGLLGVVPGWLRAADPDAVLKAAGSLYEGIKVETLPNGLRVYLKPVPDSPIVSVKVAYKVGAADEDLDQTGLSHYLEHLMFKGTDKIMPGDIDRKTLQNGGANNAYTSEDYTVYHFDFAADRWEIALDIEADRMRNLRIDEKHEFKQEKGAVIAELARNEDLPWDLEYKAIAPLLFGKKGPYGHPVIGEREHVRQATAEIIKAHYDKWYHPNNAALVIVGGFDADKALAKIKKLFGSLPQGKLPERKKAEPVERKKPVRVEIPSKFEAPRMVMGFNTVRIGDPDYYALDVIQAVLSSGRTSRLYKKLIEGEEIAVSADGGNFAGRYPGWFVVQVELLQGKDRENAEKLVLGELKRLAEEPVSDAEMKRVRQGILARAIFERESVHSLADSIARGVTTNDLDFVKGYLAKVAAVTAKDVQAVAKKYFDPEKRVVVWSVPGMGEKKGSLPGAASSSRLGRALAQKPQGGAAGSFSVKNAQSQVLPNGLTLILLENRRLPIFVASAFVRNVRLHEPAEQTGIAALMGSLLDEGTSKRKGTEIAELIEDVGGSLELSSSGGSIKVLTGDRKLGLSLLFECLTDAAFPKDAFGRKLQQQLSQIEDNERQPDIKAQETYRRLVYGKHPYGRPGLGTRKTIEKLTAKDCQDYYRKLFVPNNTIVAIVGDFDAKAVLEEVKKLTEGWKKGDLPKPAIPVPEKPKQFTEEIVTMPEAAQLHFYMGHLGIRRDSPDYFKLQVLDYVLGTGPGFTDRLSARLRDREGLAYSVSANVTGSAAEEPGLFTCYIGTEPKNFAKVKAIFLEELNRIRKEKPTDTEVEDVKQYLLGSLPFRFTSNDRIASQLLGIERFGLGYDYLEAYKKGIAAVTAEDVRAVAEKYLDPQRMFLVAAGAIDKEGKPLGKLPSPKDKKE